MSYRDFKVEYSFVVLTVNYLKMYGFNLNENYIYFIIICTYHNDIFFMI